MSCSTCTNLERAYIARQGEFIEACASASYKVCTRLAAQKNVEMERARQEMEDHRSVCLIASQIPAHLPPALLPPAPQPVRALPAKLRSIAA
jgi:hypothetical protein